MPENLRGTHTAFRLPPENAVWPELQDAIKEYRELLQKRHLAQVRIGTLERQRAGAIEQDRLALARALREGGDDPGESGVEKIDKDLANTHRTVAALNIAIEEAEADLIQLVDDSKASWMPDVEAEIGDAIAEYQAALDALETASSRLTASVALRRFLNTFPEAGYNPNPWRVFALTAPHGDPYRFDELIGALRQYAEPAQVKPKEPKPEASGPVVEHLHNAPGMEEVAYGAGAVRPY